MLTSPSRIAANKKNALKSSGPKTVEGKKKSRCNALKHGLTGEGVALPTEDADEIARRFGALADEFRPTTESGRIFVHRFAFLSVRLERCERHENTILANRERNALARFDDQHFAEIESCVSKLHVDPMTCSRRLQGSPEGLDWLMETWREMRSDLMIEDRPVWNTNHCSMAEQLLGNSNHALRVGRTWALTEALSGFFNNLGPADGEGLDEAGRIAWARGELAGMIDDEVARLVEARVGLDFEAIESDRLEAPARALFDASTEMILARKYEAATERAMHKALKEFRAAEAEATKYDATDSPEITCDPMGSFEQLPEIAPVEAEGPSALARRMMPTDPPEAPKSVEAGVEAVLMATEEGENRRC